MLRVSLAIAIAFLSLLHGGDCLAQSNSPVDLTWEAPANCAQLAYVEAQLQALVGTASIEPTKPLRAKGKIEAVDDRYRLTLSIERNAAHGTRVIESTDCRSLGKAAAVVLILLVQKERLLGRDLVDNEISGLNSIEQDQQSGIAKPPTPTPPTTPQTERVTPQSLPMPSQLASPEHRLRLLLRAPVAQLSVGVLPQVGFGAGISVGVEYQGWRALITATQYVSQLSETSQPPAASVNYGRKSVDFQTCRGWRSGPIELAPCFVAEANHLQAHATGRFQIPDDQSASWVSLGAGLSSYLHILGGLSLVASGSGLFATRQTQFETQVPMAVASKPDDKIVNGARVGISKAHNVPLNSLVVSLACEWIF